MLITETVGEGGGFQDGCLEVLTVEGIKAAHTAAESDDAKGEIGCAIKAASPNPRGPCGTHRTHRPTAGDGRGDCRWDDGAYQLIELVAVKVSASTRAARMPAIPPPSTSARPLRSIAGLGTDRSAGTFLEPFTELIKVPDLSRRFGPCSVVRLFHVQPPE